MSGLHDAYALWWAKIKPQAASPVQTEEMRRAFYSGAMCMFSLVTGASEGTESEGIAAMNRLNIELGDWLREMQAQAEAQGVSDDAKH